MKYRRYRLCSFVDFNMPSKVIERLSQHVFHSFDDEKHSKNLKRE